MTPVAVHPEVQPRTTEVADAQVIAPEAETPTPEAATPEAAPETHVEETTPPTPARAFLEKTGLIEKLAPLRELNKQINLELPEMDQIYAAVEANPAVLKRFLKLANGSWFNSRVQTDSPYMAYTRFGTEGFYRLTLGAFISEGIGELSTKFKIWPHLESVARAGEMVAEQVAPKYAEDIFAAALLHDAVVAPMERELQDYLYFLECALNLDSLVPGLESRCHDFDHAQAAAELARTLAFDEHIVETVAAHHNESMSSVSTPEAKALLGLLMSAKRALILSRGQKKSAFETATEKALLREISAALNVSPGRLVAVIGDISDTLKARFF